MGQIRPSGKSEVSPDLPVCWFAGPGEGRMINESQKCCSRCTVSATGLQRRSENVTPRYVRAVSPEARSSNLALCQPESSGGSRRRQSRYFMTRQRKAHGKRQADRAVLCSAFRPALSLGTQPARAQHPLPSPRQQGRELGSFARPLGCSSFISKMRIGSN